MGLVCLCSAERTGNSLLFSPGFPNLFTVLSPFSFLLVASLFLGIVFVLHMEEKGEMSLFNLIWLISLMQLLLI